MPKLTGNTLTRQVDLPVWEWTRQMPAVSATISAMCAAEHGRCHPEHGRYIYTLIGTTSFWRYDTWSDGWMQLSSPALTGLTISDMTFVGDHGSEGRVLSATGTTFEIAGAHARSMEGYEVRIIGGTGIGQRRQITTQAEPVVADRGIPTTVTSGTNSRLTDSTKAWSINQWVGYTVRIEFSTGVSQYRKILYSDATSLTYVDHAKYPENAQAAPGQMAPLPVVTASIYSIESSTLTVNAAWATTPDATSQYSVLAGQIQWVTNTNCSMAMYDIATDTWFLVGQPSLLLGATATEVRAASSSEVSATWAKGLATGGTTTTLIDTKANWTAGEFIGRWVFITSGTGEGQLRKVSANTVDTLTWVTVGTAPTSTSYYSIEGYDAGLATSGAASTITDSTQAWATNRWARYRVNIVFGTGKGQSLNILSNTATALTLVQPWATCFPGAVNPDATSVYVIMPDNTLFYSAHGANAGIFRTSLKNGISHVGAAIEQGNVVSGSARYAHFPPVAVASTTGTTTQTVTTVNPHGFRTGWTIVHAGDTGASAGANNISAAITVTGANTYTYAAAGSAAAWTITAATTSILKDSSKNWTVNEFATKLVRFSTTALTVGGGSAQASAVILSNTANTLTFAAATAVQASQGVSAYVITENDAIGRMDGGIATGGSQATTTLGDSSKTWVVNIHTGRRMRYMSHLGESLEVTISSNTATVLTFAAATLPVAGATAYQILGQIIRNTGLCLEFQSDSSRAEQQGRYLYSPRGGAAIGIDRFDITNNACLQMASLQQFETLTQGSMTAYDGKDRIYIQKDATHRLFVLNLVTGVISAGPQIPYVAGTVITGNRMVVVETVDKLKFLYFNRHSNVEVYRCLLFWE